MFKLMAKKIITILRLKMCLSRPVNYPKSSWIEAGAIQRGSCMVWEINMGVCPRLDFENIMLVNCLGYNFNIYGAFEFLCNSIANL